MSAISYIGRITHRTEIINIDTNLASELSHLSPDLRPGALVVRFEVSDILELVDEDSTPEVERGGSAFLRGDLICKAPRAVDVVVLGGNSVQEICTSARCENGPT